MSNALKRKTENMALPAVSVVVLNYNRRDDLLDCVESIVKTAYPLREIVVVDNNSTDCSLETLRSTFPSVTTIETGANLGYAAGMNVGMNHAIKKDPDFLLVLNSDVLVAPTMIHTLISALTNDAVAAAATGTIYYHPQTEKIWYAGGAIVPLRAAGVTWVKTPPNDDIRSVSFISGCVFAVRSKAISVAGMFDERFFMYLEDTEYCARLRRHGFSLLYVPTAKGYHKLEKEQLNTRTLYYTTRNRFLFAHETLLGPKRLLAYGYLSLVMGLKIIFWKVRTPEFASAAFSAMYDYWKGSFSKGRGLESFSQKKRRGSL